MKMPSAAGGWPAIWYTLKKAREAGGVLRLFRAMRSRNACKTCALGMGGQRGGMVNERGHFPEVCKKSLQAMAADMQGRIRPGFFDEFGFDKLERLTPRDLERVGRLTEPLIAQPGDRTYRPIDWNQALDRITQDMRGSMPDETFFYLSGRSSNEAGFLLALFARLYGTNNVNNCSFFCHQASGVALKTVTGSGTATVDLEDLDKCDLVFVVGGNPPSNHPRLMSVLMQLKRRGGKVIAVNPLKELGLVRFKVPSDVRSLLLGTTIADEYVQPHIGGDIAFFAGVAKAVLEHGAADERFVGQHCEGWESFRDSVRGTEWQEIERQSGVGAEQIRRVAAIYARSKGAVFAWTMGITHHTQGVQNVQMLANLAMMRGMVGRPGAGLLPLRGHSNVQGIGSMGAVPDLRGPMREALESQLGVRLPESPGLDTLGCIARAEEGRMRVAWHLGGNLFGSAPDSAWARGALSRIGLTIFLSTTLNTGHIAGRGRTSLILPVAARDEEEQATTQESMFSYVRLSNGGTPRFRGPRGEVCVIADAAERVLGRRNPLSGDQMRDHSFIRGLIAASVPGYDKLSQIDREGGEFHITGRKFHAPLFATASGRARFHVCDIQVGTAQHARGVPPVEADEAGDPGLLRLMTVRSEGQFNTVVYEEQDVYRGQERRDVILLHPDDIRRLGLSPDDRVSVSSAVGRMDNILVREADIRPGNAAMYYPEANELVPSTVDPASRTPAFKSVIVRIEKSRRLAVVPAG